MELIKEERRKTFSFFPLLILNGSTDSDQNEREEEGRQLADACLWNVREERGRIEEREERRTVYEGEEKLLMIRMREQEWIIIWEMVVE